MTCEVCRRPTRVEELEPSFLDQTTSVAMMACPRCRLPLDRRELWDRLRAECFERARRARKVTV